MVVKRSAPTQDMRFDLPVLGPETVTVCVGAKVRCLAVEAGKTILLQKDALIAQANEAGLSLVGLESSREGIASDA